MRDAAEGYAAGLFIGCLMAAFGLAVMCFLADVEPRETFQQEAVHHGAARWEVNGDGERRFVWNEGEGTHQDD